MGAALRAALWVTVSFGAVAAAAHLHGGSSGRSIRDGVVLALGMGLLASFLILLSRRHDSDDGHGMTDFPVDTDAENDQPDQRNPRV